MEGVGRGDMIINHYTHHTVTQSKKQRTCIARKYKKQILPTIEYKQVTYDIGMTQNHQKANNYALT